MKIRFRYNSLFILCIILGIMILIQHNQINNMTNSLSKYATIKQYKQHSEFMNAKITELDRHTLDAYAIAEAAHDMANKNIDSRFSWIDGLTTDEIDSIIKYRISIDKPYDRIEDINE